MLRNRLVTFLNRLFKYLDAELIRKSKLDALRTDPSLETPAPLCPTTETGAREYLQYQNPRLQELRVAYANFDEPVTQPSRWTGDYIRSEVELNNFRADNAYVFSDRNTKVRLALTAYYAQVIDKLGLFGRCHEDGQFGASGIELSEIGPVTRDILDSILEINFLERHLDISRHREVRILDIGAGYGRLAHRLVEALPNLGQVLCVDAVAESTFLCEYYLRYRGVDHKTSVIPITAIESCLQRESRIFLAINIHGFSECPRAAVVWWLQLVRRYSVPYLMLVPNAANHGGTKLLSQETDGSQLDLFPVLTQLGFFPVRQEPKYLDPVVQQFGISPTYYHLFALHDAGKSKTGSAPSNR